MEFSSEHRDRPDDIIALFLHSFSASEGPQEGRVIADLVRALLRDTAQRDLHVFLALQDNRIIGGICLSRLTVEGDKRCVFLLSPVAVAPGHQRQGIGQRLLGHGLDRMRALGVDVVATYGDPAYYGRVGFHPVTEAVIPAPYPLSQPEGWLAQSLSGAPLLSFRGPTRAVAAFDNAALW